MEFVTSQYFASDLYGPLHGGDFRQERELYIIVHRYGLFGNKAMTQREIASAVGISRSYVSRIEKKALDKLKKSFCE